MGFNKAFEDRKFMIFYVRKLSYLHIVLFYLNLSLQDLLSQKYDLELVQNMLHNLS